MKRKTKKKSTLRQRAAVSGQAGVARQAENQSLHGGAAQAALEATDEEADEIPAPNGPVHSLIANGHAQANGHTKANGNDKPMNGNGKPVNGSDCHVELALPVVNHGVLQDQKLVDRCIAGEPAAWSQMYDRFQRSLVASIRAFLGRAGQDIHLVDEISARVWYALVRNGFELLAKFDIKRGCRLSTFLSVLAKTQARMLLRAERRRKTREQVASRHEAEAPEAGRGVALSDEEFVNTLSPAERDFYFDVLIAATSDSTSYSRQNLWQLRHRVRRK
ncbi:MAG TPA: hypothetical protein VGJ16_04530, partial [Pirellulales bacterium]